MANENNMYVYFAFGYLPQTYYDIVNQSCDGSDPEYGYTNITIYDLPWYAPGATETGKNYTACAHGNVSDYNVITMHKGVMNATRQFIYDVLYEINNSDPNLMNTTFAIVLFAEPWFESKNALPTFNWPRLPFSNTTANMDFTFETTETYDMSTFIGRQGLADNATRWWISNISSFINESFPDILISVDTVTPYAKEYEGYNGVWPEGSVQAQFLRAKVLAESPYIDFLDFHLYFGPNLGDVRYNMTRDLSSAEIYINPAGYAPGIYANTTKIEKPLMMGEFGVDINNYPDVDMATNALVNHEISSCKYNFTGWTLWHWGPGITNDYFPDWWGAVDESHTIAINLSDAERPDQCTCYKSTLSRVCGAIENNDPWPTSCTTDATDTACCLTSDYCIYDGICFAQNNITYVSGKGYLVCSSLHWCPEGFVWVGAPFNRCEKQGSPGENNLLIQDTSGNNVARLDDAGNIYLKGSCIYGGNCNPTNDAFNFQDADGNIKAYIDFVNGDLCVANGICPSLSDSCSPPDGSFIIRDTDDNVVTSLDSNGYLCHKGGLYENTNS